MIQAKTSRLIGISAGILILVVLFLTPVWADADSPDFDSPDFEPSPQQVLAAFEQSHNGFSVDELILQDSLRESYLDRLMNKTTSTDRDRFERVALATLLQLRKSGKLTIRATRRGTAVTSDVIPVAEIATRVVMDRHRVSVDAILIDPELRAELHVEAQKLQQDIDLYQVRKAALQLRKRRALRPELVLRVADWQREVRTYSLAELSSLLEKDDVPHSPGVYLFRHPTEGYLYIGEAADLSTRLAQHLENSDRKSLAEFLIGSTPKQVTIELHVFPADSPASRLTVRRAYESELIRSRSPKFNVRP
ncbi:hypothetical protein Pla52n_08880 [Stieleria varia]|uniref:GIY-YIG domain-containing protein n=2 Tax=Stieleria varia TaxID=2528005 RepID=A0A5C6BAL2_9BACT|nr:hypothetical protein Pla52n_08880 [Stieleria varia]